MTTFEKLIKHQDEIHFPIILETVSSCYRNGVYYQIIPNLRKFKEFKPFLIKFINIIDTNNFKKMLNEKNILIFFHSLGTSNEHYTFAFSNTERNQNSYSGANLLTPDLLDTLIKNTSALQKYRKKLKKLELEDIIFDIDNENRIFEVVKVHVDYYIIKDTKNDDIQLIKTKDLDELLNVRYFLKRKKFINYLIEKKEKEISQLKKYLK